MEMNVVRAVLEFFWIPVIRPLAGIMGYNSPGQLLSAKRGQDAHKSWALIM